MAKDVNSMHLKGLHSLRTFELIQVINLINVEYVEKGLQLQGTEMIMKKDI